MLWAGARLRFQAASGAQLAGEYAHARSVAARPIQTFDKPQFDWIVTHNECEGCRLRDLYSIATSCPST